MPNCEFQEMIGGPELPEEEWAPALKLMNTPYVFRIEKGYVLLPVIRALDSTLMKTR